MTTPKLSILLVTKNRAAYLGRFFKNMEQQMHECGDIAELIVIDGGSNDGATDIIRDHEHLISYWVSEPDSGVSEAVNKGLAKARGEFVKLAGDEDIFWPGALNKGIRYLDAHPEIDCVIYHVQWMLEDASGNRTLFDWKQPVGEITVKTLLQFPYSGSITPESALFRTASLRKIGGYDEKLHPWAYWDMWLRQAEAGCRIVCVPEIVMDRIQTPLSDGQRLGGNERWHREFSHVLRTHGNNYWRLWHKFGGAFSISSVSRYYARTIFQKVFGMHPRRAWDMLRERLAKQGL